jgi:RNA polymerase subunit RPABC4/transcription elongation factor Spt4
MYACGRCRAVVPFDCRFIRIHHESYSQENIKVKERFGNACCVARYRPQGLADVIELCPKCHTEADAEMRRRRLLGVVL